MVEQGRHAQILALKAKGWKTDRETERFEDHVNPPGEIGGPTFMKDPDGRIYACTGGVERLVVGEIDFPEGKRTYRAGKAVEE